MRNRKTSLLLVALLSLTLLATGCPKDQLKKAANYGNSATQSLSALQGLAINLNQAGKLDDEKTAQIIRGVLKANNALQAAKNTVSFIQSRVKAGGKLSVEDQADLQTLFRAFGQAVRELNQSGVLGVKNAESKAQLDVIIATVLDMSELLMALW
jgi:hypothetical protein